MKFFWVPVLASSFGNSTGLEPVHAHGLNLMLNWIGPFADLIICQ
jgi:hypothetical protein